MCIRDRFTLIAGGGVLLLAAYWVNHIARAPILWMAQPGLDVWPFLLTLSGALALALCFFQGFAWSNFPRCGLTALRLVVQFAVLLLSVGVLAWVLISALTPPNLGLE